MSQFDVLVDKIENIGHDWHGSTIIKNSEANVRHIDKSIKDLPGLASQKASSAVVVSAGPSLHYTNTLKTLADSKYQGTIIAIDGSYVKCLRAGIVPDYVLTLDPHPTRLVRWFGDPDFEKNTIGDDYFARQDLDIDFRKNSVLQNNDNIEIVNRYAKNTKLIIASTAPANVVSRTKEAGFDMYWWLPLVDNPESENSLTRRMYNFAKLPALNTGGNVGTAAWVFAQFWLKVKNIAVIGMDLGYKIDLPYTMTQTYYELAQILGEEGITKELFPVIKNPLTGEKFYTDPTYYWYRRNILELVANSASTLYNCTEGGTLFGDGITCIRLKDFLDKTDG
ncbi:MAG: motility associated factor glycosyltransferase family protein [Gammaproteobacteria bacterium]|nr:motility associated factor glycosyltransferase family protein [Gammaproteobacteria bacterium]